MLALLMILANGPILCPDKPNQPDGPCEPPTVPLPDDDDGDERPKVPEPTPKPEPS